MNRDSKTGVVEELQQRLENASAFYVTDFTGLNVKQITEFRSRLRKQGVEYVVVKNTLAKRALAPLEIDGVAEFFSGPTGLVIGPNDPVSAAKALTDFAREFDNRPVVKAGVVERKPVAADQVKRLAEMPPREVLLAQLVGGLQAPMSRLLGGMNQILAGCARAVDALRRQREEAGS